MTPIVETLFILVALLAGLSGWLYWECQRLSRKVLYTESQLDFACKQRDSERDLRIQGASSKNEICEPVFSNNPADEPTWSKEKAQELARFIHHNETGQSLMVALEWWEQYMNRSAVLQKDGHPYQNGVACGWHKCVAYLKSISSKSALKDGQTPDNAPPQPGQSQQADPDAIDPADHYAP